MLKKKIINIYLEEKDVLIKYVLLTLLLFPLSTVLSQQKILEKRININVINIPLDIVLEDIQQNNGIMFSYNSDLVSEDNRISINRTNITIQDALIEIFSQLDLEFKVLNDIIIISSKKQVVKPPKSVKLKNKGSITKFITVYDTIITEEHDTIVHTYYDTLKVYYHDTVVVFDTLMTIERLSFTKTIKYELDAFYSKAIYNKPYINYPTKDFPQEYSLDQLEYDPSQDISYGLDLNMSYRKWFFKTGINYSQHNQSFTYNSNSYSLNADSTINIDISYEEVLDSNSVELWTGSNWVTLWFVDTTNIPVFDTTYTSFFDTSYNSSYKKAQNKIKYFSVPIALGRTFRITPKLMFQPELGLIFSFIQRSNTSNFVLNEDEYNEVVLYDEITSLFVSIIFAGKIKYKIDERISIFAGARYIKNVTPILSNQYLIQPTFDSFSLMAGISYKFK